MQVLEGAQAEAMTAAETRREPFVWLARALLVLALLLVGIWTVRRTTWYLAIDQFGYLTFAADLAEGHALHHWELLPALAKFLPETAVDIYAQTYVRRGDAVFSRYSPGFPLVLALVRATLGPQAEHYVNPVLLLLLLVSLYVLGRRVLRSEWLGLGAALLGALLPNYVLLWSTSPLRDVPAHLFALAALAVLLSSPASPSRGRHEALAGLLLGFAVSTRVDAVLYLIPAGGVALLSRVAFARRFALGALGFLIGVAPLLAYNYVATGNPLRPTQAMEMDAVMSRAPAASTGGAVAVWSPLVREAFAAEPGAAPTVEPAGDVTAPAATPVPRPTPFYVQGGGLRLSHLTSTLPANLIVLREAIGDLGLALGVIGAFAALRSPALFLVSVPYILVSVPFFSLWTLPGPRYLTGVLLLLPFLILEGARSLATLPAALTARGMRRGAVAATALVVLALALALEGTSFAVANALPWVNVVLAGTIAVTALCGLWSDETRTRHVFCVALGAGLAALLFWRSTSSLGGRASFQRPQVERARATLDGALQLPAVVLTSTQIGRPAENINYYTDANALYLEEMTRWRVQPRFVLTRLIRQGFSVYLLLPPEYAKTWLSNTNISTWYSSEVVRVIPPAKASEYFVASPYHRGIELWLVRMDIKPRPRRSAARP